MKVFQQYYDFSITLYVQQLSMKKQVQEITEDIKFYGTSGKYGFLSNFYLAPFRIGDHTYPTNQHFFQSKKFIGTPQELSLIQAPNPKIAKSMGRKNKMVCPEDWPQVKEKFMLQGLRAKFGQNQNLKEELLKTGNLKIREHTGRDKYWGDGGKKFTGKNRLGELLMKVRQQLRTK